MAETVHHPRRADGPVQARAPRRARSYSATSVLLLLEGILLMKCSWWFNFICFETISRAGAADTTSHAPACDLSSALRRATEPPKLALRQLGSVRRGVDGCLFRNDWSIRRHTRNQCPLEFGPSRVDGYWMGYRKRTALPIISSNTPPRRSTQTQWMEFQRRTIDLKIVLNRPEHQIL